MQVLWIISTHTGEIDYILPLLQHLKKKKIQIKVIFFNLKVFKNFNKSNFYKKCFHEFDVKYININFFQTKLIYLVFNLFILAWYLPLILYNIIKCKFIFFEKSFSTKSSKFFSILCNFFKKEVLLYPHSVQVYNHSKPQDFRNLFEFHTVLLSHNLEKNHYTKNLNFFNYILIGHPYLSLEWKNFINKNFCKKIDNKKKIISIILGKIYGKKNFYIELFRVLSVLKKKEKNLEIFVKIHPSMNLMKIKQELKRFDNNVEYDFAFTNDHITECAINSDLTIIVNNSAAWVPALLERPYLDYCSKEYKKKLKLIRTPVNSIDNNSYYKMKELENKILKFNFEAPKKNSSLIQYKFKKNSFYSIFKKG